MFISYILDIAGKDLNPKLFHIFGSLCHNLVRERIPVCINGTKGQRTNDLTHVALKRILQISGDLDGVLI